MSSSRSLACGPFGWIFSSGKMQINVRSAAFIETIHGICLAIFWVSFQPLVSTAALICDSKLSTWLQLFWIVCPIICCLSIFLVNSESAFSCCAFRRSSFSTSVEKPLPGDAISNFSASRRASAPASCAPRQASTAEDMLGNSIITLFS